MSQKPSIEITCQQCETKKLVTQAHYDRGAKFCSHKCYSNYTKAYGPKKITKIICSYCNKEFERRTSKLENSKSGLYFCSTEHKALASRLDGLKEIHPAHYGMYENGTTNTYRRVAFSNLEHKCNRCNYSKQIKILQVHHIDRDRNNNTISNLEILCPTCHYEEHFLAKDGPFTYHFRHIGI